MGARGRRSGRARARAAARQHHGDRFEAADRLDGRAHLHNTENWLTSFDTDDPDDQLTFEANAVHWSDGSRTGYQHPPCLREGRAVPVRVGYTWVDMPGETSRSVVAWVECRG